MHIHTYSSTSLRKKVSEDACVVNERANVFGVFDGATPLVPFYDEEGRNGAYLASHTFSDYFSTMDPAFSLKEAVILANRKLRDLMSMNGIDLSDMTQLWSTCVAVVRFEEGREMSYAQLGDSIIMVERKNGSIDVLTRDTVHDISKRAKAKRERDRLYGIVLPDESFFDSVNNRLLYNRTMANTPDGYSVANGTPETEDYICTGRISLESVRSILLITDGLFASRKSLTDAFVQILDRGLENYALALEEAERRGEYPSDDKTGIWIRL